MENLKEKSVKIDGGTVVCWPQFGGKEEAIDMTDIEKDFDGAYCVNNSTICFVNNGVFVTPYTDEAISTMEKAGLTEKSFYVPFSNWDYPKFEKGRWNHLRELAK